MDMSGDFGIQNYDPQKFTFMLCLSSANASSVDFYLDSKTCYSHKKIRPNTTLCRRVDATCRHVLSIHFSLALVG